MSVYKDPRSPNYTYEFQMGGQRFKGVFDGCTNERDAKTFERDLKKKKRQELDDAKFSTSLPISIAEAVDRYCAENATTKEAKQNAVYGPQAKHFFETYKRRDGSSVTLLQDLTDVDISAFIDWKKSQPRWGRSEEKTPSAATVNHATVKFMRRVSRRATVGYGVTFKKMPIWSNHILTEANRRKRRMSETEHVDILNCIDHEYAYLMQFALLTGIRQTGSLLKWENVSFADKKFKYVNKGDDPTAGDELKERTMIPDVEALLRSRVGHHPVWVFTYIKKSAPHAGKRFPVTKGGLTSHWRRLTKSLGVKGLWWHDLRRTFASHMLKVTGKLATVQDLLDHASPVTTRRYAWVDDEDLVAASIEAGKRFSANFHITPMIEYKPSLVEDKSKTG